MQATSTTTDLLERWDRQQAVYITRREQMYDAMFETLSALSPLQKRVAGHPERHRCPG